MKQGQIESKYKYMLGEPSKERFEGIILSDAATESNFIRSNGLFTAIPWKSGGGGVIAVMKAYQYKKLEADLPLIRGHAGPVIDFDFSPFNDNLLATASEDGTVKFWIIPDDGVTKDVTEFDAELRGHSKKLIFAKFHPSSDYTMATSGADSTIRLWDISNQKCVMTYDDLKSTTTALEWSHNGSLLGLMTKEKTLNVFDPRKEGQALVTSTHEGARPQKLAWLGDSQTIFTAGFSKVSEREYAIWDTRNFANPLIKKRLDDYAGVPFPYFDEDARVLYIAGKGESAVSFFQYSTESPNYIDYLHAFKGKEPQKGFSFMPKRIVDVMPCEVARAVRLTAKTVEYVSFKVPRKSGTFQADLFPPCKSNEPAMKFEEYWTGVDKEPLRIEMRPEQQEHHVSIARRSTFLAKLGEKNATVSESQPVQQQQQQNQAQEEAYKQQIADLTAKVEELNDLLNSQRRETSDMQERIEQLVNENQQLKSDLAYYQNGGQQQYESQNQEEQYQEQQQEEYQQ